MCDDGEPPATQSNLGSYSKPQKEVTTLETMLTTKLIDLNEDCLNELLGRLNVIELCYLSRACKQLQKLAQSQFNRKYCHLDFSTLFRARLISNQEARDVLLTFGPMITSMSIQRHTFHNHEAVGHVEERILEDVVECCSAELDTLTLKGFCLTSRAVEALNLLSGSLTELALKGTVFVDCVLHLINFSSLASLTLSHSTNCEALFDTFPNLTMLELSNVSFSSQNVLHHFFARHSQMKELTIEYCIGVSSEVVRFVAKYLKNLQTFTFYENFIIPSEPTEEMNENFLRFSELKSLDCLVLSCHDQSIGNILAKMVANKIALKTLQFSRCLNDAETIEAIVQMKCLEELHFVGVENLYGDHLIKCAKELPRLKMLSIGLEKGISVALEILRHTKELIYLGIDQANLRLDPELYYDILEIVKERRNGINLEIVFLNDDLEVSVPHKTIQANEYCLILRFTRFPKERQL